MKYIIDIIQLEKRPDDWTTKTEWPGDGVYMVKGDTSLYAVNKYGVDYISYGETLTQTPFVDQGESVSESLLLKAIAAASRAEVLK